MQKLFEYRQTEAMSALVKGLEKDLELARNALEATRCFENVLQLQGKIGYIRELLHKITKEK